MKVYVLVSTDGIIEHVRGVTTEDSVVLAWVQTADNQYYVTEDYTRSFKGLVEFWDVDNRCDTV